MVLFNELRITEDRKCLIVDCEVDRVDLYSKMYIDSIYVEYYKNAPVSGMPSDKAFLLYEHDESNPVKSVRRSMDEVALRASDFGIDSFKDGLFYVIVKCDGRIDDIPSGMPCGYDNVTDIAVILDWKSFYERGIGFVSSMFNNCGDKCAVPSGFEQFILLWNALKLAISVCDWEAVNMLWDNIIGTGKNGAAGGFLAGCGCNR